MENIVILVDAMGGDHGPSEVIKGCLSAAEVVKHVDIVLLGPEDLLKSELEKSGHPKNIKIEHAPDVIEMDEEPAWAVKNKSDSTIVVGSRLVKKNVVCA